MTSSAPLPHSLTSTTQSETPSAESTTVDDDSLRQYASLLIDIKLMETHILGLWHRQISTTLPDLSDNHDARAEGYFPIFCPLFIMILQNDFRHLARVAGKADNLNKTTIQRDNQNIDETLLRCSSARQKHSIAIQGHVKQADPDRAKLFCVIYSSPN